ncbi:MAG: DUF423 domain-containing protein [Saprospiraceae bacterium]|nr:DUF423 domain-containing protein [Saprospiraceae bacterium]
MKANINLFRTEIIITAICGAAAVGLGAFGAHGLKPLLSDVQLTTYQTAVQYHFIHTLALLALLPLMIIVNHNILRQSFYFLFTGIVLFSGSLYLISADDITEFRINALLGPVTPLGGLFLIAGWLNIMRLVLPLKEF